MDGILGDSGLGQSWYDQDGQTLITDDASDVTPDYVIDPTQDKCLWDARDRQRAVDACKRNYAPSDVKGSPMGRLGAIRSVYSGRPIARDTNGKIVVGCYPGKDYNCYEDYDPCHLKNLPACGRARPPAPETPSEIFVDDPPPFVEDPPDRAIEEPPEIEEVEDDDDTKMVVGGILALLVVGGGAYYLLKKKKKKR